MHCNPCQESLRLMYDVNYDFVKDIKGNWDNHRPLLLLALELTEDRVFEYGSGEGSTPYLRDYCKANSRHFYSLESNKEWADKMSAIHVPNWRATDEWFKCGVAFVDLAPGEDRVYAIEKLAPKADIIVIHDTEEGGAGDYKFETIWQLFKYRLNYNKTGGGAGATAVSNTIDLNRFRGLSLGPYTFDND
jgi:hypothetical protein